MSLLLTDGLLRKTLAAARSVGGRGVKVVVGETTRLNPAAFSRYCRDRWTYPDPKEEPNLFFDSLCQQLEKNKDQVLFPMDDAVLRIALERQADLSERCRLLLPSADSCGVAADKGLAAQLAAAAGVETPLTCLPGSLEELHDLANRIGYPIVIKPSHSSGSRGIRIVEQAEELLPVYEQIHGKYPFPLLQQYIPTGVRYDVCLLFDQDGKRKASFVQKELRHYPLPHGPSTMQESVWMPELVERAMAIMDRLPWRGVVELEFMEDPRTKTPVFMEINPRFWNSLQLAIQSGVDFPWLLYRLAQGEPVEEVFDYRIGQKCRNILPGEWLHFFGNPDRWRHDPPFWAGQAKAGQDDILSWGDPLPTVGFAAASVRLLLDRKARSAFFKR